MPKLVYVVSFSTSARVAQLVDAATHVFNNLDPC